MPTRSRLPRADHTPPGAASHRTCTMYRAPYTTYLKPGWPQPPPVTSYRCTFALQSKPGRGVTQPCLERTAKTLSELSFDEPPETSHSTCASLFCGIGHMTKTLLRMRTTLNFEPSTSGHRITPVIIRAPRHESANTSKHTIIPC